MVLNINIHITSKSHALLTMFLLTSQDSVIVEDAVDSAVVVEEDEEVAETVEVAVASAVAVVVDLDAEAVVDGEHPVVVVVQEVVEDAEEPKLLSLNHIVTRGSSSHVERRTRWSLVIWYLAQKCTERRGFQSM